MIEVPADRVEEEYKNAFNKIQKSAKVDGFRKGKAPLHMVEAKFAEYAEEEVAESIIKTFFYDAVTEKGLNPISQPKFQFDRIARNTGFSFTGSFEVMPSIEIGKYKEIPVEEKACNVTNDDVDMEIDSVRERQAVTTKKEDHEQLENGNVVTIMLKRIDDVSAEEKEKLEFKEYTIVEGKSKDESALDKKILGMKTGEEREIDVKYPKDYYIKDLAGQKVTYLVKIKEMSRMELPALDDEFAKKAGYESLADMKKKTREYLERFVTEKTRGEAKAHILNAIMESSKFDIPETMVKNEVGVIFRKTQERIGYYSDNLEQFASILGLNPDDFYSKLRDEALKSVKTTIALSEIIKKEDLKVSEEKYKDIINKIAEKNNKSVEEIEGLVAQNNSRENIEMELLMDMSMDFIYDNAKVKKMKAITLEELLRS